MISITYNGGAGSVTEEEAAGKRGSWGRSDHLLINKMIQEQVIANRTNLVTVWLDYQKACDSIPHSWLIRSLVLAKVPEVIINPIPHGVFWITHTWGGGADSARPSVTQPF